ncbi:hypothetical protein ANANG_G00103760, partial [Anguilla anguilla]
MFLNMQWDCVPLCAVASFPYCGLHVAQCAKWILRRERVEWMRGQMPLTGKPRSLSVLTESLSGVRCGSVSKKKITFGKRSVRDACGGGGQRSGTARNSAGRRKDARPSCRVPPRGARAVSDSALPPRSRFTHALFKLAWQAR